MFLKGINIKKGTINYNKKKLKHRWSGVSSFKNECVFITI